MVARACPAVTWWWPFHGKAHTGTAELTTELPDIAKLKTTIGRNYTYLFTPLLSSFLFAQCVKKTKRLFLCVAYNPHVRIFKRNSSFPYLLSLSSFPWQDLRLHLDPKGVLLWGKLMYSSNDCREVIKSRNGPCLPTLCGKWGSKGSKKRTRYSTLYTKTYSNCTNWERMFTWKTVQYKIILWLLCEVCQVWGRSCPSVDVQNVLASWVQLCIKVYKVNSKLDLWLCWGFLNFQV